MILKREIGLKLNSKEAIQDRQKTTMRIISMLGVNFKDENEKAISIAEFGTFLKEYTLTSKEVIEAYRMAAKREFSYKLYPTLSVIQAGEVLELYQDFKRNDLNRQKALKHILEMENQNKELSDQELKAIDQEFDYTIFLEINKKGFSDAAFVYYKTLEEKGKLRVWDNYTKRRFFNYVQSKYLAFKKAESTMIGSSKAHREVKNLINKSTNDLPEVKKLCKSIFASNYLRKCKDFTEFNQEIQK